MRLRFAVLATLAAIALSASAQSITRNIRYTADSSGSYDADLYQPSGAGPFPVIVYIHGGSWRSGSKKNFSRLSADLAAKGYAGFAINYDLKSHSWPLSLQESSAAVTFLRTHAAEYKIDPNRIVVAGESAGGQLAALVALDPHNHVTAGLLLNGVYDLTGNYWVIKRYLGGPCKNLGTICKDASPMSHIHPGAAPLFIGHGTSDHLVPFASAELFSHNLKAAGDPVTFYPVPGAGHSYWSENKYYAANLVALTNFLATLP